MKERFRWVDVNFLFPRYFLKYSSARFVLYYLEKDYNASRNYVFDLAHDNMTCNYIIQETYALQELQIPMWIH